MQDSQSPRPDVARPDIARADIARADIDRRQFTRLACAGAAGLAASCSLGPQSKPDGSGTIAKSERMPVLFLGHGSPMNAILDNQWSRAFKKLGANLPTPKAILAISAHWYVDGTYLTANEKQKVIYDIGGFPSEIYELQYPAAGNPNLAKQIQRLLGDTARLDSGWGLDHGTWSVLCHLRPKADVPVLQLSIDRRLGSKAHFELGRSLSSLRDEGVMILGSGNITHNFADARERRYSGSTKQAAWAKRFDDTVVQVVEQHDHEKLTSLWPETADGKMAHPTPDHWFPLLYAAAASDADDEVSFPVEGFSGPSFSMRAVRFG